MNVHALETRGQLGRAGAAPLVDDSQGPIDPADLAAGEAESGTQRVAGVADAGDALSALSLGGFCPVSFVKRGGLLAPVDPMVGGSREVAMRAVCLIIMHVHVCLWYLHAPLPTPCNSLAPWQALCHVGLTNVGA